MGDARQCHTHLPDTDDLSIDLRLWGGDLPAVYDAMVEAMQELRQVADAYGDCIGDAESLERVQAMRAKCKLKRCDRD